MEKFCSCECAAEAQKGDIMKERYQNIRVIRVGSKVTVIVSRGKRVSKYEKSCDSKPYIIKWLPFICKVRYSGKLIVESDSIEISKGDTVKVSVTGKVSVRNKKTETFSI